MYQSAACDAEYVEPGQETVSSQVSSPHVSGDGGDYSNERDVVSRGAKKDRQCSLCQSSFSKLEHLTRHVRSHTKERPFQCSICNKRFARHDTLLRHIRSHPASRQKKAAIQAGTAGTKRTSPPQDFLAGPTNGEIHDNVNESQIASNNNIVISQRPSRTEMAYLSMGSFNQRIMPMEVTDQRQPETQNLESDPYSSISSTIDIPQPLWGEVPVQDHNFSGHGGDMMHMPTGSLDYSELDLNSISPSWIVGDDFDLHALNSTIQTSISQFVLPQQLHAFQSDQNTNSPLQGNNNNESQTPAPMGTMLPPVAPGYISKKWFSNIGIDPQTSVSQPVSPGPGSDQADVDEAYRLKLTSNLHIRSYEESLPSTDFLNLCIRMYFTRFNNIFPLLHGPTFRPSNSNSLLLLSICSIGSLFIGSTDAITQGTRIFERLNKAVLATWEHHLSKGGAEALSMVQAAVIGQTFGLLSGNPWHLTLVDAFHGTVVAWARRSKMFSNKQVALPPMGVRGHELYLAWKVWAHSEETIRILLGLHVHDSELASIFHHEPILRHNATRVPLAASSTLFMASTADQWIITCETEQSKISITNPSSHKVSGRKENLLNAKLVEFDSFTAYAYIAGIAARICELRSLGDLDQVAKDEFVHSLVLWYREYRRIHGVDKSDPLCLIVLWHSTFMTLFADLDMLERAVGRDAPEILESSTNELSKWISSLDARRCIIHGLLAHKHIEEIPIGTEPAIHVPRTLFLAGITLFCYTSRQIQAANSRASVEAELLDISEMKFLDISSVMYIFEPKRSAPDKTSAIETGALCNITDLLQRIGHWNIARKYASTLKSVLHGEKEGTQG